MHLVRAMYVASIYSIYFYNFEDVVMKKIDEQKMTAKERQIYASYQFWDDDDISTERLLALVCDDCNCDVGEVTDVVTKYMG